ncbi:hypothetical protein D3C74_461730 [compost metagenome]
MAMVHQHIQQVRDRQEAGVQTLAVRFDQFHQPFDSLLLGSSAQEPERDRNHVAALQVAGQPAILPVGLFEGALDRLRIIAVLLSFGRISQYVGYFRQQRA